MEWTQVLSPTWNGAGVAMARQAAAHERGTPVDSVAGEGLEHVAFPFFFCFCVCTESGEV
eukprot:CAMPEP_0202783550 /NCGR_PEP_ID=MMETSP1388-20130828/64644_1 /ASSEMBLY_ACC=CAM_ASM_000864 /TAXON_ID=37098 /ORGANISM="Isochrysis sp, Strain CCMP1244" /LENGTH=59 /DNA_ID=CAMNT_0049453017 /DNA_START=58 /DNA_END=237 /DNA_ORIENTATION=-